MAVRQLWSAIKVGIAAISLLLLGFQAAVSAAPATGAQSSVRVYLMRGFANVFSLGMDELAAKLRARGIPADAYNHLFGSALAAEAAAGYKSGKIKKIVLIGHSLGADAVVGMVEQLGQQGVPVALAVTMDISSETVTDGIVGKFLNYYVATGALKAGPRFHGSITNIDVSKKVTSINHFTIDKNEIVQRQILANIAAAR